MWFCFMRVGEPHLLNNLTIHLRFHLQVPDLSVTSSGFIWWKGTGILDTVRGTHPYAQLQKVNYIILCLIVMLQYFNELNKERM